MRHLNEIELLRQLSWKWGFRRSRTAFRDEPEHPRSVATLAIRCKKCSASSRKNCPKRSGGREPERGKGRGERRHVLSSPQHTVTRSATSAPVEPSSPGVRPSHWPLGRCECRACGSTSSSQIVIVMRYVSGSWPWSGLTLLVYPVGGTLA